MNTILDQMASKIEILVTDVDGVMTDGGMYYAESGDEWKRFSVRDGAGVALLHSAGVEVGALTGETTEIVSRRLRKLNFDFGILGAQNKRRSLQNYLQNHNTALSEVAYIGDEINDVPLVGHVGIFFAVRDAADSVYKGADYVLERDGGEGALEETAINLLQARGGYEAALESYWESLDDREVAEETVLEID